MAIVRDIGNRRGETSALGNLGICHQRLGDYRQAIDLYTQALGIARDTGHRRGEGIWLDNLGICHQHLGDYRQAIDLYSQALGIAREIGNRRGETSALGNLGICHHDLGDYRQAIDLHTQALAIARDTGHRRGETGALGNLAWAHLQLGDPVAALAAAAAGQELPYPAEEPTLRLLEGLALLELHRADEGMRAFNDALTAADALLALEDRNIAALQARALALSGLAAATGDPAWATQALEAFTRTHAVTSAAGVAADTRRLLDAIACHDRSSILAGVIPV